MGDDSDDSANIFVIRMDNRFHYVSLTSNMKRAQKRKEGFMYFPKPG